MTYDIGHALVKKGLVSAGDRVRMMIDPMRPNKGWLEATVKSADPSHSHGDSLTVDLSHGETLEGHGPLWGRVKVWVIGQNDGPRFNWLSEDCEWAVIKGANSDHLGFVPSTPVSYGYASMGEATCHDRANRALIVAGRNSVGTETTLWRRYSDYCEMAKRCWYLINTADLNWSTPKKPGQSVPPTSNGRRVIPDYPKICKLCRKPAYLGLNEVVHDPRAGAQGCRGLVDP